MGVAVVVFFCSAEITNYWQMQLLMYDEALHDTELIFGKVTYSIHFFSHSIRRFF